MLKNLIRNIIQKYFDYEIVGHYYDTNGDGKYYSKHIRKYYLKCLRKRRVHK